MSLGPPGVPVCPVGELAIGQAFPMLRGALDRDGTPVVELRRVAAEVADGLANVLVRAARLGVVDGAD